MGALLSLPMMAAQMACCCGTAACNLCCASCPNCPNSVAARFMYGIMLIIGAVTSLILLSPGIKHALVKVPYLCKKNESASLVPFSIPQSGLDLNCEELVGYAAVYRITFGFVMFFAFMAVLMLGVSSSRDPRALIQRGFWFFKYLMVVGAIIGAFFIPQDGFASAWMIIGVIGAFLFIIIQSVLLIDFAHTLAKSWLLKMEDGGSRAYQVLMASTVISLYGASIAGIVLMYIFYGYSGCGLQQFFISVTLLLCVIQSAIAIIPRIQDRLPHSGLLQSSVVSVYAVYVTWCAVSNWPYTSCQPGHDASVPVERKLNAVITIPVIVTLIAWVLTLVYSCIRTAERSQVTRSAVSTTDVPEQPAVSAGNTEAGTDRSAWDDEVDGVSYSFSFAHFMYLLASLYMMMTITQWYSPSASATTFEGNTASTWIQFTTMCIVCSLYIWTLLAPMVFPNREFS